MTCSTFFGDTEFILIKDPVEFKEGLVTCQSLNANVARVSNEKEFRAVQALLDQVEGVTIVWVGLEDLEEIGGNATERFTFVDGSQDGLDFFAEGGKFPWSFDQPNDFPSPQHCVA